MKKWLAALCAAILLCAACCAAAESPAAYESTGAFLALMDAKGMTYTLEGLDGEAREKVVIRNTDAGGNTYDISYFFEPGDERCALRVWNLITFDAAKRPEVLRALNTLNSEYRYVRFHADESDNTVTASMDLIFHREDAALIVWEATLHLVDILETGCPALAAYGK